MRFRSTIAIVSATGLAFLFSGCASGPPRSAGPANTTPAKPSVFRDLDWPLAQQNAAAENKPIFVFFDGDWAEDSQKLLEKTFPDRGVATLLRDRTVALRIDVVSAPELTRKYHVSDVPLMMLVSADGTEIDRWSGYEDPRTLARELSASLAGNTTVERLQASVKADDVNGRFKIARKLVTRGSYDEALCELLWIYDTGIGDRIQSDNFLALNATTVIYEIGRLQNVFPAARASVRERADREEKKTLASPNRVTPPRKLIAWLRVLQEEDRAIDIHRQLPPGKARDRLRPVAVSRLVQQRNYLAATEATTLEETLQDVDILKEPPAVARGIARVILFPFQGSLNKAFRLQQLRVLQRRAQFFELYAGADRPEEARRIARIILDWDRFDQAPAVLRAAAQRARGETAEAFIASINLPALLPKAEPKK